MGDTYTVFFVEMVGEYTWLYSVYVFVQAFIEEGRLVVMVTSGNMEVSHLLW